MLLEDTEKISITEQCQITVLFLLTIYSTRQEHFTECNRMPAIHILYITYGWHSRSSRSLKDRLSQVTDILRLVQVCFCTPHTSRTALVTLYRYLSCFYTPYTARTAVVTLSHSVPHSISARYAFYQRILQW
jgi:hypothetical protein